jgi:Asp-tRNA(Asn)/Glu-tRNA(Gln) amidotransferase A subunit family amidase
VELNEVETLDAQSRERAIDRTLDKTTVDRRQRRQVRHELRMDLELIEAICTARSDVTSTKLSDHFLDTGIDVGTIECVDTGVIVVRHVGQCALMVDISMLACQLPAAFEQTGDRVTRGNIRT